jgi:hypothetical protein
VKHSVSLAGVSLALAAASALVAPAYAQSAPSQDAPSQVRVQVTVGPPANVAPGAPAPAAPPVVVVPAQVSSSPPAPFAPPPCAVNCAPDTLLADATLAFQLDRTLRYYSAQDHASRMVAASMAFAAAAGFGVTSAFLFGEPALVPAGWMSVAAAGAMGGLGLGILLWRNPLERLSSDYRGWLATMQPGAAVRLAEARWQVLADEARMGRIATSIALMGLGAGAAIGLGVLTETWPFVAGSPTINPRIALAALAATVGVAYIAGGLGVLFIDSEMERGLHVWRNGHERPPAGLQFTAPGIAISQNGFTATLGGRF